MQINYIRVNKILLKHNKIQDAIFTEKKSHNNYTNVNKQNQLVTSVIIYEAKLDFNKTCQINMLNYKMIENIIYNIENHNQDLSINYNIYGYIIHHVAILGYD